MDLEKYRKQAEDFISEADKEYYLHFSGQKVNIISPGYMKNIKTFSQKKLLRR